MGWNGCGWAGIGLCATLALLVSACGRVLFDEEPRRDGGAPASDARVDGHVLIDGGAVVDGRPVGTDAGPDAGVDADGIMCDGVSCPDGTLCASDTLCHPILFSDDFEDGIIAPEWVLMRFAFAETGGRLETLPMPRDGFLYGHVGNGRSGVAALHIGDMTWTDIRLEWTQQSLAALTIVDASLPPCQHTPGVQWRVAAQSESWNAPEATDYGFAIEQGCGGSLGPQGGWLATVRYGYYIPGTGWSAFNEGTAYSLGTGLAAGIADEPMRFILEARGRRFTLWIGETLVFDVTDVPHAAGEEPIAYGGVAFNSAWEQMFWIDDVVVADLTR